MADKPIGGVYASWYTWFSTSLKGVLVVEIRWTNVWHVSVGTIVLLGGMVLSGHFMKTFLSRAEWSDLKLSLVLVSLFYILIPFLAGFFIYFIPRWSDGETTVVAILSSLVFTVFLVVRFWLGGFSSMSAWETLGTFWLAAFVAFSVSAWICMRLGGWLSWKLRARSYLRDISNDPEIK